LGVGTLIQKTPQKKRGLKDGYVPDDSRGYYATFRASSDTSNLETSSHFFSTVSDKLRYKDINEKGLGYDLVEGGYRKKSPLSSTSPKDEDNPKKKD
jgi:hypothetical protein